MQKQLPLAFLFPRPAFWRMAVGVLACGVVGSPFAHAQTTPSPADTAPATGGSLDMPLDTGSAAKPAAPAAAAPPVRRIFITNVRQPGDTLPPLPSQVRTISTPLASRGASVGRTDFRQAPTAVPATVVATLGLVSVTSADLRVARDSRSRLLNVVHQGMYLAVVADGGTHYGVLMVNNTMGWISKSALQMIDYQTVVSLPALPSQTPARPAGSNAAQMVGGLASGLDARPAAIVREAFSYLGVPYVWAGNTRNGLDCSAFVKNVYAAQGISLPRHSGDQLAVGQAVSGDDLRAGDRLYFDMGRKGQVSHCGIYLGNGLFIHASTNHGRVDVDSLLKPNYLRALVAARR